MDVVVVHGCRPATASPRGAAVELVTATTTTIVAYARPVRVRFDFDDFDDEEERRHP